MKRLLVLLMLMAACVHAQQPTVLDSAFVATQWEYVLLCTGLTPQPGGRLHDVNWHIVPNDFFRKKHALFYGLWIHPDTIVLDSISAQNVWIMRHELLHHLLRGPPPDQGGPHPWFPFAVPCEVMAGQHFAGFE